MIRLITRKVEGTEMSWHEMLQEMLRECSGNTQEMLQEMLRECSGNVARKHHLSRVRSWGCQLKEGQITSHKLPWLGNLQLMELGL